MSTGALFRPVGRHDVVGGSRLTDRAVPRIIQRAPEKAAKRRGPSLNQVSMIGRIATDPVLRYTSNGVAVTNFRLANNGTYEVQFHRIVAWRGLAEIAAKYLSKGRLVYVSGRLGSRTWTGQDGVERWELEITAADIQFLSAKAAGRRLSPHSRGDGSETKLWRWQTR
jgi:single-strand DNA-binding protein